MSDVIADIDLLAAFESCTLPCDKWTHVAHIRVGYLYASQFDRTTATVRMRSGLHALNAIHGTPESLDRGYHETITVAFMRLICTAIQEHGTFQSSEAFCQRCPELLNKSALLRFYSRDRLMTLEAKRRFIEPDLAPLPYSAAAISIRHEKPGDYAAIEEVNRLAFRQDDEANLVTTLRAGGYATLSLVAQANDQIVGHVLFGPLTISTPSHDVAALSLAPMAVAPHWQRQGIGTRLIEEGLQICRGMGHKIVVVVGHPEYYPRFGFCAELAKSLTSPFTSSPAWMALELAPGALHGIAGKVIYPPPFDIVH